MEVGLIFKIAGGGDFSDNFKPGAQAQAAGKNTHFAFPGGADSGAKLDCTLYFDLFSTIQTLFSL